MIEHNLSPEIQSSLEELVSEILMDEQLVQVGGGPRLSRTLGKLG